MNPADRHQLAICLDTLKNPNKGMFMGGPTYDESLEILKEKFGYSEEEIEKLLAYWR